MSNRKVLVVLATLGLGGIGAWLFKGTRKAKIVNINPGRIWWEPLPAWEKASDGMSIPLGSDINLAPQWVNQSQSPITSHVDLLVKYPSGTKINPTAYLNQDQTAAPRNGWSVAFNSFPVNQTGTYTITVTLSVAGKVVGSLTYTLVAK